jgi:predicted component of type VI protein secretion system
MKELYIIPLYVPAACTDVVQELDVGVNKPFKNTIRKEFDEFVHADFEQWADNNPDQVEHWVPKIAPRALKLRLSKWVDCALEALKTDDMRRTIPECFASAKHGCFEEIRGQARMLSSFKESQSVLAEMHDQIVEIGRNDPAFADVLRVDDCMTGLGDTMEGIEDFDEDAEEVIEDASDNEEENEEKF